MPVARLAQTSLAQLIAESADPASLWLFLHIPKTAGSSLSAELRAICPPYRNIFLSKEEYAASPTRQQRLERFDALIDKAIEDDRTTRFGSLSGHMNGVQAERIRAAIGRTQLFTFLREPVDRVVSDYRYQRSPLHPPHEAFSANYPTLASYIDLETDRMYRTLSLRPDEPVDELIDRIGQTYAFVGLVEMYPFSFNVLTRLFGDNRMPSRRERVAAPNTDPAAEATPEIRSEIAERNARDVEIYEHFRALLRSHREAWQAMRAAERAPAAS